MTDVWDPAQYERFKAERMQPFRDLLSLCAASPGGRAVDLGCGTGEPTRDLHRALGLADTLGVDRSAAMLARSAAFAGGGLRFRQGDLATFQDRPFDMVFSNAALHWVDDQEGLLARLAALVAPGGQLAFQVPANHDHPGYVTAADTAGEEPFRTRLGGWARRSPVLAPERYAQLLDALGLRDVHVRLQVYLHHLAERDAVVEWNKGTVLTDYAQRLGDLHPAFVARYRERLRERLSDDRPFLLTYKRILAHARKPA